MVRPLDLSATAVPTNVGTLRRSVRQWLAEVVDDADLVDDLTLAVSEALENAADHAYVGCPDPGTMNVRAQLDVTGSLVIHVVDDGTWRTPVSNTTRGRGIALMEELADAAIVETRPGGTAVTLTQKLA